MVRAVAIAGFLATMVLAALLGVYWLQPAADKPQASDKPACYLLAGPCEWQTARGPWHVSLQRLGAEGQETQYRLAVKAPVKPDRFLAVLRGESMYMGEYPVPLRGKADGKYLAEFTAPLCTTGEEMVWRIDLQQGQSPLAQPAPLKLVFRTRDF